MSSFVMREIITKELNEFSNIVLYYYDNPSDAELKLKLLRDDEEEDLIQIMSYGDNNQLKDACNEYPLLASGSNGSNLVLLEDVECYKLYNSYEILGERRIYSSTHSKEESFNSLVNEIGGFQYGIIIYE